MARRTPGPGLNVINSLRKGILIRRQNPFSSGLDSWWLERCAPVTLWEGDRRWALCLKRPALMDSSERTCPLACGAGYTLRRGAQTRHASIAQRSIQPGSSPSGTAGTRAPPEVWARAWRRSFAAAPGQPLATRRPLNALRPCDARAWIELPGLVWTGAKHSRNVSPLDPHRLRDGPQPSLGACLRPEKLALLLTGGAHNAWRKGIPVRPERPRARTSSEPAPNTEQQPAADARHSLKNRRRAL